MIFLHLDETGSFIALVKVTSYKASAGQYKPGYSSFLESTPHPSKRKKKVEYYLCKCSGSSNYKKDFCRVGSVDKRGDNKVECKARSRRS